MKSIFNSRYIPQDSKEVKRDDLNAIVYISNNGSISAIAYSGKRKKPDFNYRFRSVENMESHIADYFKNLERVKAYKDERKQKRIEERKQSKDAWKVGDILSRSWGYNQTNVNFYQIIEVKGHKVVIREICSRSVEGSEGFMCCKVVAMKDVFKEDESPIVKLVNNPDYISFNSYSSLSRWNGQEKYCSWYA